MRSRGIRVVNDADALVATHDKLATTLLLEAASMPQPRAAWATDAELATLPGRLGHRAAIDAKVSEWTRQRSNKAAFDILRTAGVTSGPVYKTVEVLDDPQLEARGFWRTTDHAFTGPYLRTRLPFRLTRQLTEITHPTNLLGEHNRQVLTGLLGYSDAGVDALESSNVIGNSYAKGADID